MEQIVRARREVAGAEILSNAGWQLDLFSFFSYQYIISLMVQYVIISLNLQIIVTWFLQSVLLTRM